LNVARLEFQTERFDVFYVHVERNPQLGCGRDVYMAWHRHEDVPRSVCEVTLWGNYIEWLHVCEEWRRNGVATEVMRGLEKNVGELDYSGVTEAGEAFCAAYEKKTEQQT